MRSDRGQAKRLSAHPLRIAVGASLVLSLALAGAQAHAQAISAEPADEPSAPIPSTVSTDEPDSVTSPAMQATGDAADQSTAAMADTPRSDPPAGDTTTVAPFEASPDTASANDAAGDSEALPLHLAGGKSSAGHPHDSSNLGSMAIALPPGSAALDAASVQRVIARLVALHVLGTPMDAQDPALLAAAIRSFQSSIGIASTGALDRDTLGRLLEQ